MVLQADAAPVVIGVLRRVFAGYSLPEAVIHRGKNSSFCYFRLMAF